MLYLTTPPTEGRIPMYQAMHLGVMVTPHMGNKVDPRWAYFACDNGCFAEATGKPFDLDRFLAWLSGRPRERCLFAVAPDVVCDWAATVKRSTPVLPQIRDLGFPAALVLQNGIQRGDVDWDTCDAVFVGGDDTFKYSHLAAAICADARAHGKWVHVGRVNSHNRLRWCRAINADSADGTYVGFGPDQNLPKVARWLRDVRASDPLPFDWDAA